MPARQGHDTAPPAHWPSDVIYLAKPRLSPSFPSAMIPLLCSVGGGGGGQVKFKPRPIIHPPNLLIKAITSPGHPANGQLGLYSKKKIQGSEMLIPYIGEIHHTLTSAYADGASPSTGVNDGDRHSESDYDLSLLRVSATDPANPFLPVQTVHISIGVDAARMGNAARFVNDYRGIGPAPNAEFRVGKGEGGEWRMEIWSLKGGIGKGEEVLVSYGKGWWGARAGAS